jgi:hypothetical protein
MNPEQFIKSSIKECIDAWLDNDPMTRVMHLVDVEAYGARERKYVTKVTKKLWKKLDTESRLYLIQNGPTWLLERLHNDTNTYVAWLEDKIKEYGLKRIMQWAHSLDKRKGVQ